MLLDLNSAIYVILKCKHLILVSNRIKIVEKRIFFPHLFTKARQILFVFAKRLTSNVYQKVSFFSANRQNHLKSYSLIIHTKNCRKARIMILSPNGDDAIWVPPIAMCMFIANASKAKTLTRETMAIIDSRYFRMRRLPRNESYCRATECKVTESVT